MGEHRFRFFLTAPVTVGGLAALSAADTEHLRVVRAAIGDQVELVDTAGAVYLGALEAPGAVRVGTSIDAASGERLPQIVLYAGAMPGQRWDALLNAAVQAGVTEVVPVAASAAELAQMRRRSARAERLVEAAAKQSKRSALPRVGDPVTYTQLDDAAAGIVFDELGGPPAVEVAQTLLTPAQISAQDAITVLVGPPAGFPPGLVDRLVVRGWRRASLGPIVLRTELAAPVAVAMVVQAALMTHDEQQR